MRREKTQNQLQAKPNRAQQKGRKMKENTFAILVRLQNHNKQRNNTCIDLKTIRMLLNSEH